MHDAPAKTTREKPLGHLVPTVLKVPAYLRLWYSSILYYHANQFEIITAGWVVLVLTGTPVAVGVVGFCRTIPMFVFGILFGAIADRFRRTDVLLAIQIVGMCVTATLALLFGTGAIRLWEIFGLTALLGCGWATDFSVRRALISELQDRAHVVSALSLESMSTQGNKIAAAFLSGFLLAVGNPALCYAWLACIYGCNCLALVRLRRYLSATPSYHAARGTRLLPPSRGSFAVVIQSPVVLCVLLITVVMNLLVFPYQQMLPVIGRELLHVGSERLGILAGADGIGGIIIGIALTRRAHLPRQGLVFVIGAFGIALLVIGLALSRLFAVSYGTQIALGICSGMFGAMQSGIILNIVAADGRSRAMGVLAMAIGVGPFGILFTGYLSSVIGPTETIAGMALLALALMTAILARIRVLLTH